MRFLVYASSQRPPKKDDVEQPPYYQQIENNIKRLVWFQPGRFDHFKLVMMGAAVNRLRTLIHQLRQRKPVIWPHTPHVAALYIGVEW
jgi:hypothetical protein